MCNFEFKLAVMSPDAVILVAVKLVKVPALAVELPITVLSMVPPSISGVLITGLVKVLFVNVSVPSCVANLVPVEGNTKVLLAASE